MSDTRPNILLLFTDMQRHDTIAAINNPVIKTPNLDRLVREGTAFTHAYTPSPVCVPARCCMHYGKHPQQTGLFTNGRMMDDDGTSYVQRLGEAGYRTHAVGKLHFTPVMEALRGLQSREIQEEAANPGKDDYMNHLHAQGYDWIVDPHGARGEMYYSPQIANMPQELHPTHWVGDRSCAFIEDDERREQPWYLMTSFIHPHPPFNPPNPWQKLYRGPDMPLPLVPVDRDAHLTWANLVQNRYKYRDQGIDTNHLRQMKAYYYACISFVDFQVGRILESLEISGQLENTLIVFTSDHGEHLGDRHCFGKRSMHDTSTRIPMIARLPGVFPAGVACEAVTSLIDLAPTFCSVGGASSEGYQGERLQDIATGGSEREFVFSQHGQGDEAEYLIASTEWTYFYSAADDREYCYHLATDPQQQRLVGTQSPFQQDAVNRLRSALQAHLREQGGENAAKALDGDDWRRYPTKGISSNPDDNLLVQDCRWSRAQTFIPGYSEAQQYRNLYGADIGKELVEQRPELAPYFE